MHIYEIVEQLSNIENFIDEETGEVDVASLNALNLNFQEKMDNLACVVKSLQAESDAIKQEEQTLSARRKAKEKRIESLKRYIAFSMNSLNYNKLETTRSVLSFRSATSLVVSDEAKIDSRYKTIEIVENVKIDKNRLKADIKAGITKEVGCELVTDKHLQIK